MRTVILSFLVLCLIVGNAYAGHSAKVTIKAMNEQGTPIEGAKVTVGFMRPNTIGIGSSDIRQSGFTSKNGEFTASDSSLASIGFSVDKDGYYQSGAGYEFTSSTLLLNRWEPWNPTIEVVLKKIRNPVAMIIKGTDWVDIPKLGTPIGYDLQKSDWVAPYGNGSTNDLEIKFDLTYRGYVDYDANMTITFPNGQDGIQEYWFDNKAQSSFRWPFEAPVTGYKKLVNVFERDNPKDGYKTNKKEGANYIFRVRTILDKDGSIISAKYGKIKGEFGISREGSTKFFYYLNPDGTRNLEEDPKKNLFKK